MKTPRSIRVLTILLSIILFWNPLHYDIRYLRQLSPNGGIKSVLKYLKSYKQSQDKLYVYYKAKRAFDYYAEKYGLNKEKYILGVSSRNDWNNYVKDLNKLEGNTKVWILFGHVCSFVKGNEEDFFLTTLDNIGKRLMYYESGGLSAYHRSSVYLYDLSK